VPRYLLFLKELQKTIVPSESHLRDSLGETEKSLDKVMKELEDFSKKSDKNARMIYLEQRVFGGQVKINHPSRSWVADGLLVVMDPEVGTKKALSFRKHRSPKMLVILLTDILILAKPARKGHFAKLKKKLDLSVGEVQESVVESQHSKFSEKSCLDGLETDFRCAFSLLVDEGEYIIFASTAQEKEKWVKEIKRVIANAPKRVDPGQSAHGFRSQTTGTIRGPASGVLRALSSHSTKSITPHKS
jgi:hypothetical protein